MEVYKCLILTLIAGLLFAIAWRIPPPLLTLETVQSAKMEGWQRQIPLVFVGAGNVNVDNVARGLLQYSSASEKPLKVEVMNEVEVTGAVQIEP